MDQEPRLNASPSPIDRRSFLSRLGWSAAFASFTGFALGGLRYVFPNVLYEPPVRVSVGPPERFPPGEATYLAEERVFILRDADGLSALSSVCTHLGCSVRRVASGFECPCHGSRFAIDGKVAHGPAPKPLPWRRLSLSPRGLVVCDLASEVEPTFRLRV